MCVYIYIYSICISCALGTIMHYIDILFAYMILLYVTNGFVYVLQLEPWSGLPHHPTTVVGIVGTQRTSIFCASCVKIPLRHQPGRAQRSAAEGLNNQVFFSLLSWDDVVFLVGGIYPQTQDASHNQENHDSWKGSGIAS